jgi:hypothetical protein
MGQIIPQMFKTSLFNCDKSEAKLFSLLFREIRFMQYNEVYFSLK